MFYVAFFGASFAGTLLGIGLMFRGASIVCGG